MKTVQAFQYQIQAAPGERLLDLLIRNTLLVDRYAAWLRNTAKVKLGITSADFVTVRATRVVAQRVVARPNISPPPRHLNLPFVTLSFVSLLSISESRLTDKSLVDVRKRKFGSVVV